MRTTRVEVLWLVGLLILGSVGQATAASVNGSFDRDGFWCHYSLQSFSSEARFNAYLSSETHQINSASISIYPDYWGRDGENKVRFLISGNLQGTRQQTPSPVDLSSSLSFSKAGVDYYQSSYLSFDQWENDGILHSENYGSVYANITGAKWDHLSVNYSEWTEGEGGGKGVVGVASLTDSITTFSWNFQAHGYFDDPIKGAQFLGAVPEPTSVVLLSLLAAGMKFSRRRRS